MYSLEQYRQSANSLLQELASEIKANDYAKISQSVKLATNHGELDSIHLGLRFHKFRVENRSK